MYKISKKGYFLIDIGYFICLDKIILINTLKIFSIVKQQYTYIGFEGGLYNQAKIAVSYNWAKI